MDRSSTRVAWVVLSLVALSILELQPAASASGSPPEARTASLLRAGPATPGAQLWVKRYREPRDDVAYALGMSPDGSTVFVTGYSFGSRGSFDYATVAYSATTGALLWVRRYNGPTNNYDLASALGVSTDGSTVFVTGHSYRSTSLNDYATVAYKASTGARLWVRRYNGPANAEDVAGALRVSPDGSAVFVTGESVGSGSIYYDYATVAYSIT